MKNIRKSLLILLALLAFGPTVWAQNNGVSYIDANGNPATCTTYTVIDGNTTSPIGTINETTWYVVQDNNVVINGQLGYNGNVNLILCDGAKLTINATGMNALQSLDDLYNETILTIYGQTNGTGQLIATATANNNENVSGICADYFTINRGVISATGRSRGIHTNYRQLTINGGTVTAEATDGTAIEGQIITINGGIVSATGNGGIKNGGGGQTYLGYTNSTTDYIIASNYQRGDVTSSVEVKDNQFLISDGGIILYGGLSQETCDAIAGDTLRPYSPQEWSGSGTAQSPYIISTVDDLNLLCLRTKDNSPNNYNNKYYQLGADITYNATSAWNDTESNESNFMVIAHFFGHFDGAGHTISGIRTDHTMTSNRGLFGSLLSGAYVENLTLTNTRITGSDKIGGIAGAVNIDANIHNCHVTSTVDIHAYAYHPGSQGGIAGKNLGVITNCISEATLSLDANVVSDTGYEIVGGIAGDNTHVGYEDGNLRDNFVIGANITCQSTHCGTISGKGGKGIFNYYYGCMVNGTPNVINMGCDGSDEPYSSTNGFFSAHRIDLQNAPNVTTSEASYTYNGIKHWAKGCTVTLSGGLDGTPSPGCTKAYYVDGVALRDNSNSFIPKDNFNIPTHDAVVTVGEIHYDWYEKQTGTEEDPYLIYFPDQLDLLATRVNSNYTQYYQGKYFKLMADLEYDYTNLGENESNYTVIGGYYEFEDGHFDGNGHNISGIRIRGNSNYQGLFGKIKNAEVKNLLVFDTQINGASHIGVIAGNNDNSTLTNNYYFNCQVGENTTGVGCDGADVTANNGAVSLHTITVNAQDVSVTTPATLTHNSTQYWAQGTAVTLSNGLNGTPAEGWQKAYFVNNVALIENALTPANHFNMPAADATVTVGEIHADWASTPNNPTAGDTENNPYKIYFTDQLDLLATRVNSGTNYENKYFKLMDNLPYIYIGLGETESNYTPIGGNAGPFRGHFDGNHKTISGIRIRNNAQDQSYHGIFGHLVNAEVTNLYVDDAEISGYTNVGGIVGLCVTNSVVTGCRVTDISLVAFGSNFSRCGGIAGLCDANSTLSNNLVVGITIPEGVISYGAIAGVGNITNVTLTNNYYRNCTVGSTSNAINVGCNGIDIEGAKPVFTLTLAEGINATATPTVVYDEVNYFKEGVAVILSGGLNGTPAEGYQKAYFVNGLALTENALTPANHFDMPAADVTVTVDEIHADWATANAGTAEDPYRIYFTDQFDAIAARMVAGRNYYGAYFKLMNDLEYDYTTLGANESNYTAIGDYSKMFSGHFDGNHKTISGIRIRKKVQNQQYQGVFGYLNAAEITNLYLDDAEISGFQNVGGIAGLCVSSSVVTGCRVTNTSLIATENNARRFFGGIAGTASSSTLSNNLVVGITIPEDVTTYGAIAGTTATFAANYYRNCTVGSTQNVINVGSDGSDREGAKPIFTLNAAEGIVVTPDPTIVYNEVNYYEAGIEITLTVVDLQYGYNYTYSVNDEPIGGNSFNIDADATITVEITLIDWTTAYDGNEANPYLIGNAIQWNTLATNVNNGATYDGKFFKLIDNIEINTMVGNSEDNSFRGTFNGDGHTLIFNYTDNTDADYCAPFRFINGATIKRLRIGGSIVKSNGKNAAGFVGKAQGTNYITSCISSVEITFNKNGDVSSGGFVGDLRGGATYFTDCLFNGKLLGTSSYSWGGFIGWVADGKNAYFTNCLFNPTEVNIKSSDSNDDSRTFARRNDDDNVHISNCYYNTLIKDAQGATNASGYSNGQLRAALGDGWELKMQGNVSWVVPVMTDYSFQGEGTEESPYLITSVNDWNGLSTNVYFGETYNGKYFQMTRDISVSRMVGTYTGENNYKAFSGTFNGDSHTLTINVSNQSRFAAPFKCVNGATIRNLRTAGTIDGTGNSDGKLLAGIVGVSYGNTSIKGCLSSASIITDFSEDAALAGIVAAYQSGVLTVEGCVFNGSMTANTSKPNRCGGIVGYRYGGSCSVRNSVFAPTALNVSTGDTQYSATIARTTNGASVTINNCYYTQTLGTVQGSQMYSITPDENITMELYGIATEYNAIGLTFYDSNEGIKFNDKFYAAQDNSLELGLSYIPGYTVSEYFANGIAILWSEQFNCYTLTMPAMNVIITANATLVSVFREIEGYGESEEIGWAFIASPVVGSIEPTAVGNIFSAEEFDLYRLNPNNTMWENWKVGDGNNEAPGFHLENGRGYLYATKETKTLTFTGEFIVGTSKEITGLPAGFNLVGNPFTVDAYVSKSYYTLNGDGSAILTTTSDAVIPPCYGVIVEVENNESVTFNTSGQFSAGPNNGGLQIAVSQVPELVEGPARDKGGVSTGSTTATLDNAIVSFNEGERLGKFYFGSQNANIYLPQNGKDYAIAFSEGQGEMPLNFKANRNGQYTISVNPEDVEMAYLHLIDNMTGADIDLLQTPNYSFNANVTDYESRFKLVFASKDEDGPSTGSGTFAFFSDGNWIIANEGEATLQVIDLTGRILSSETVNGSVSKTIQAAPGVYMLRLINGDDVKVQKIVVR